MRRSTSPSNRPPLAASRPEPTNPRRSARATTRNPTSWSCSAPVSTRSASRWWSAARRWCSALEISESEGAEAIPARLRSLGDSVSRSADPVILDAAHFRSLASEKQDRGDLVAAIPIEAVEDEVRLFVVATRDPHLAISEVEAALRATLKGLTGAAALAATTTFLADRLGAEIAYQFRVTNDPQACAV